MQETAQEYTQRLLSYADGKDPLRLQQAAPGKLAALLKGKTGKQLMRRPASDKWSIAEILAHLADAELAISWRLRQILASNAIPIQAYDQDLWARTFNYARRDPRQSLASFRALREANLALLKSVPRKLWENYGVHAERGNESVHHVVRMVAGHDLNHLQQIQKILSASKESTLKKSTR
ncbi:MAG: DinB family protein [Candidatus Angelobacter sp.]